MSQHTTVSLPKQLKPQYPDRCVICGAPHPDHKMWLIVTPTQRFASWPEAHVPACRSCSLRLHAARWSETAGVLLAVAGGVTTAIVASDLLPNWAAYILGLAGAIASFYALATFVETHPQPFDIELYRSTMVYTFRNASIGHEFAALNKTRTENPSDERARLLEEAS